MPYVSVVLLAAVLAACTVTPPSVRVDAPVPVISVETHEHGHGHGQHCPPGQAKKGRC